VQVELALDRDLPALQALRRAAIERERRSFAGRGRLLAAHLEAIGETDLRNVADAHRGRVVAVGERADVARRGLPLVLFVAAERVLALQEILVLQEVLLQKIVALFLFAGAVRIHRAEAPRADDATSRRRRSSGTSRGRRVSASTSTSTLRARAARRSAVRISYSKPTLVRPTRATRTPTRNGSCRTSGLRYVQPTSATTDGRSVPASPSKPERNRARASDR